MIARIFTKLKSFISSFLLFTTPLFAQDGVLDKSFGNNGIATTDLNNLHDGFTAMALQDDDKIILLGRTGTGIPEAVIIRYNEDGSIDSTFGSNGIVSTPLAGAQLNAVKVQNDGKILVAGSFQNDFLVSRFTTDGQLDTAFGTNGIVITDYFKNIVGSSQDRINCINLQNDGKILVGGYAKYYSDYPYAIARYNIDGSLDTSFGLGGKTIVNHDFNLASGYKEIYDLAVTPEGKIYAVGETSNFWTVKTTNQTIARFNSDGTSDLSLGGTGEHYFELSDKSSFKAVKLQDDGKLVLAGNLGVTLTITRMNENGDLDTTFSNDGRDSPKIGSSATFSRSVSIQPDGKIIVSGSMFGALSYYQPVIIRYLSNGKLDTTFSDNGISKILVSNSNHGGGFSLLQPNGKLLVGGDFSNSTSDLYLFCLTTGVKLSTESFVNSKFISYPNPAKNFITIVSNENENFVYRIFDVSGKLIKKGENKTNENIDIQNLQKGNYILQLKNENSKSQILKLIKN